MLATIPSFLPPLPGKMADIHPLDDSWPEKLPYEKQSSVLPSPEKPGHSGSDP